jgi:hypothetical protein
MSRWAIALVALAGCAQFRPPAEGGGGGGEVASSSRCAAPGEPYSYADELGSTVTGDGLHIAGKLASAADVFAGVGIGFADGSPPLDASRYDGIVFAARRSPGSVAHARLKVPDVNTDPAGGVCTDCYNDFGLPFQVTEEWTRYEVRFEDLIQETGWGAPRPEAVDRSKLDGVQWQVAATGAAYELWIRDVGFLGCDG